MVREIKEHMLGEAIAKFRDKAFEVISNEDAPNVYPHVLMLLGSMMHGVAQALAIVVSKSAQEAKPNEEGRVTVNELMPRALTNDTVSFAALLMLRMHRVVPGEDGGVVTEISPDIVISAVDDFKKLYDRDMTDINSMITEIMAVGKSLPQQTHNYTRTAHLN